MIRKLIAYMREQLVASESAPPSEYRDGFQTALQESLEYAEDILWEEAGDDAEA